MCFTGQSGLCLHQFQSKPAKFSGGDAVRRAPVKVARLRVRAPTAAVGAHLGAATAHPHRAPGAGTVPGVVEEEPAAAAVRARLQTQPRTVDRGGCDEREHPLDEPVDPGTGRREWDVSLSAEPDGQRMGGGDPVQASERLGLLWLSPRGDRVADGLSDAQETVQIGLP